MSAYIAALAAAGTTAAVGLITLARSWPTPSGQRRAGTQRLRPVEALDRFEGHCPIEGRRTLQIRFRLGGEMCTECRNTTTTSGDQL